MGIILPNQNTKTLQVKCEEKLQITLDKTYESSEVAWTKLRKNYDQMQFN